MAVQDVPNPIVHRVSLNPENETRKVKTRLEEIFEEREERAAKRFSAAELEKMAVESENEVARLRGEPPKYKYYHGGETMDEEEKKKQEEKQAQQREKITTQAVALINSGMEPAQVGQMLMGLSLPGTAPIAPQGLNFKDVMEMVTFMVGKKEADELKEVIAKLDKKIDDMARGDAVKARVKEESKTLDPILYAKQQAEAVVAWNNAIRELMPEQRYVSEKGESLEIVKERNRHTEKLEEIKNERDYKQGLVEVAGEIPERIGYGMAGRYRDEHSEGNNGGGLEHIICSEKGCGTKIYITPGTKDSVTCPRCGAIYARKGEAEPVTEG